MKNIDHRPWYREFWVWFVIAFPLAAVVAGVSTVIIANSGDDSLVVDDFRKVGLIARRETALEREAEKRDIAVTASIDRKSGQIMVRLEGDAAPETLSLGLFHPTRRDLDRSALLLRDQAGLYRGNIGRDVLGHWYIQVQDNENDWRITDRLARDASLVSLGEKQ